jgi:RNA polymerase sigma-70 factor (ECF subfamily)
VFRCIAPAVYAAAIRLVNDAALAEDVVQDVFIDIWCHPTKYQPALGSLRNYLCLRAQHRVLDLLRSDLRRVARQQRRERLTLDPPQPGHAERIIHSELGEVVREAVRRLPQEQRELIDLTYFQGLSYRDAARCAGIPEGTAKSRLRLALAKLETLLARDLLETS